MYAVIETGGKQYRVQPGDILQVEKLEGDVGSAVKFDKILFASKPGAENSTIFVGKPLLSGASVGAEIVGQGRGDKILIIKMKRRKQYRRTQGHRQFYTQVLVTSVDNGSGEKLALSDADKKTKLDSFISYLAPKGLAHTPKTLGSRKRLAAQKAGNKGTAKKESAAKPETAAKTEKKPAAKAAKKTT
ncbi:MAG: 50S ribosomal protein L21 [Bdellovibrionales bacterium]|nr:50S ribosomal protein L21 [Bdellovibrionales bacterium]